MKTLDRVNAYCNKIASRYSQAVFRWYIHHPWDHVYLATKPRTNDMARIPVLLHPGKNRASAVIAESIPRNLTQNQIALWIADKLRSLPILPINIRENKEVTS